MQDYTITLYIDGDERMEHDRLPSKDAAIAYAKVRLHVFIGQRRPGIAYAALYSDFTCVDLVGTWGNVAEGSNELLWAPHNKA